MAIKNRELPPKEASLFKSIVKFYEFKQYKKGIKVCEQILKKFPEHGETLALKGLCYSYTGRKEEALECIKRGIKNDLTSHICWHVYGLYYRTEKNYEEAIRCYKNALKYDRENLQIIRDLSTLQIQTRQYQGFLETRSELLHLKPGFRVNWVALAIGYHLVERRDAALKVFKVFEDTLKDEKSTESISDFEYSEILHYKLCLQEEAGELQGALENATAYAKYIADSLALKEITARLHLKLGNVSDAEKIYHDLLSYNPDSSSYLQGLESAARADAKSEPSLGTLYAALKTRFPSSRLVLRRPLDFLEGQDFLIALDTFAYPLIKKGAPSLFNSLKRLYDQSHEKMLVCESYFLSLLSRPEVVASKQSRSTEHASAAASEQDSMMVESVSERDDGDLYVWVLYYLGQHYDRIGQYPTALQYLDEAIERHGSVVEFHMSRGRVLKHAGDLGAAQECMQRACQLDLSDRFSNSKSTKYLLRTDRVLEAQEQVSLFLKGEFPQKLQDLVDMQCFWYESELGESYMRTKQYGKALKFFHMAAKHFEDILDDQFDFHNYCLRKMTLCHYLKLLRFEDRLHTLPYYRRVAMNAIQCYLDLHDRPCLARSTLSHASLESLSIEDKKAAHRPKRVEDKQANHAVATVAATDDEYADGKKKADTDPDGESYLKSGSYLEQAAPFVRLLQSANPKHVPTLALCTQYYMRKGKWLLALRCLLFARELDVMHPDVIAAAAYTLSRIELLVDGHQLVNELLCQTKAALSASFLDMQAHADPSSLSLPQMLALARSFFILSRDRVSALALLLERFDYAAAWAKRPFSHADIVSAYRFVSDELSCPEAALKLRAMALAYFPLSAFFKPA